MNRLVRFALKPASEKQMTARFLVRKTLSRLPFIPVRMRLRVAPEDLYFWWSYIAMDFHADRSLREYWGNDCGELRFLWRFLKPGMTFFDVGAFHGMFSMIAGMKFSGNGKVVAFEPSARERRRFELHRRMNGLAPMRLEPCAVSDETGHATFFTIEKGYTSMNSLRPPPTDHPVVPVVVDKISLDAYMTQSKIHDIDLLKIDVEGGELEAFRGARGMLNGIRPIVICEVLDGVASPWGYEARETVHFLREEGYEWFDFCEDGTLRPHAPTEAYPEVRNYLAVPREKVGLIEDWRRA